MIKNKSVKSRSLSNRISNRRKTNRVIDKINETKDLIAIKDENKDGYIVLKQESLYKPLLIVFGIFLFVMVVLFPVSIFDTLWPDGMMFFRNIVKWGFFSAIATLLPLPFSIVDGNLLASNIFTGPLFTFIFTLSLIVVFDTFFAFVGYKSTRTLRKLFVKKTSEKDERKVNERFQKYGNLAMYFGASTPLPFTLMVYTAGALKLPKRGFVMAVFLGRITKYALFSIPMRLFGFNINTWGSSLWESLIMGQLHLTHYVIFSITGILILWLVLSILKTKKKIKVEENIINE